MKKSFRVYLFFQILFATGLILLANRQVAQHFLVDQMKTRAHQEMARILSKCGKQMSAPDEWTACNKGAVQGDVLNPLNELFVPCSVTSQVDLSSECSKLRSAETSWSDEQYDQEGLSLAKVDIEGNPWHVVTADRETMMPAVLLSDASLWFYLRKVWALRDRNLIYTLPTIILMLGMLTAYMVYVVMRPIRSLEKTLSTLTFQNLREQSAIQAPYVEFKSLANVYRDLLERLEASYESAKRFAADAAHELRTPLSILRGNVERLIAVTPKDDRAHAYVQNLSDEVDRLVVITEKLLMLSRADNNSLVLDAVPLNLSDYLHELLEDAASFHPNLQFIHRIEPGVIWSCDKALIEQLINNLYSNAVKYNTPRGGWIEVVLHKTDKEVWLTFKNSSVNVPSELPQKAFERFYRSDASRTRRTVDGLGLGLSICKEIAQAHGGTISLEVEDDYVVSVQMRAPLSHVQSA